MIGRTLGHYKILETLGVGGMGEVYRARDQKLERDVAVKMLPGDLSADPTRLVRFEREAKLLAALSHSNIAAIHGLEEADGVRFLVMELIDGESLEHRLVRGAMPVREALGVAAQLARALGIAHQAGIVHRDVKPANILVTGDGTVMVLDFGLAKSSSVHTDDPLTERATSLTVDGTVMGTPPYMSPEQVRGRAADERSDIWAFACVVYETLTGKRAFGRETMGDTLAAVLDDEPNWNALPDDVSPLVEQVLRRCLRKDADRRLHDVADARIEIEEALDPAAPATVGGAAEKAPPTETARGPNLVMIRPRPPRLDTAPRA